MTAYSKEIVKDGCMNPSRAPTQLRLHPPLRSIYLRQRSSPAPSEMFDPHHSRSKSLLGHWHQRSFAHFRVLLTHRSPLMGAISHIEHSFAGNTAVLANIFAFGLRLKYIFPLINNALIRSIRS